MRSLYAGLGFILLLAAPEAASAQAAFTVTRPTANDIARPTPDTDDTILRYRRTSAQQELIFRRAARAAALREARIQSRRRTGRSASRPNMRSVRPQIPWFGRWQTSYPTVSYRR
ncbi:MAG: hypothetical protein HON53_12060 [Planctomycetaceae bacterium]|jgi:hypothetical protein|nr:hypothetical protein [Planctomycetaceae bacterium]MBT6154908.1 hypothetical protein [Planctomycetaceae bacterium]MBT6485973.1 hypothetical protein [Planctomycetaceae bacterium]MBT6497053.1 hypothetical protein [Planctomycetaceae bacterium]